MTKEIIDFLENNVGFLATKGTCGNPRVRPMQSPLWIDNKFYCCTNKQKGLYKHILNHNGVELTSYDNKGTWIRIRANVKFVDDISLKEAMFNKYPLVKEIYKSVENEDFAIMHFDNLSIKIQDFSGRDEIIKVESK